MLEIDFPEGAGKFSRVLTKALFQVIDFLDSKNNTITTYRIKKLEINGELVPKKFEHRNFGKEIGIVFKEK